MANLHVIEIPLNSKGLPAGTWIEASSLRLWLAEIGEFDLEQKIHTALEGPALEQIDRVIR